MNIYKLKYTTKAAAEKNLKAKGVYVVTEEGLTYGTGIHAVVEIGKIVTTDGTYDEEGNEAYSSYLCKWLPLRYYV
jgi:hypothetical protein